MPRRIRSTSRYVVEEVEQRQPDDDLTPWRATEAERPQTEDERPQSVAPPRQPPKPRAPRKPPIGVAAEGRNCHALRMLHDGSMRRCVAPTTDRYCDKHSTDASNYDRLILALGPDWPNLLEIGGIPVDMIPPKPPKPVPEAKPATRSRGQEDQRGWGPDAQTAERRATPAPQPAPTPPKRQPPAPTPRRAPHDVLVSSLDAFRKR